VRAATPPMSAHSPANPHKYWIRGLFVFRAELT
jgi:hypothetical protein